MKALDYATFIGLALLGVFIWLRDTAWYSTAEDTLPVLVAIPLFIWLGTPWKFQDDLQLQETKWLVAFGVCFMVGIALNITFLLALGWCFLLWRWLSSRVVPESKDPLLKLMVLPLMAFPWVALDADRIGWWFRLSGAWTTAEFFTLLGFEAHQEGTQLLINKLPISVEVACAGMNTLQSILIAGTVANFIILGKTSRYWWNLPMLVGLAWVSNTLRIIFLSAIALAISPEFAMSSFHTFGGWLVLVVMFLLCWALLAAQEPKPDNVKGA